MVYKVELPVCIVIGVPTFDESGLVRVDNKCVTVSILIAKALLMILISVLINDSGR